ncbi:MAG: hypothetical protein WD489_07740 [Rhodovibrionaceae bacterium]
MDGKNWLRNEPSIDDILQDPIVRLLMRRDGVSEQSLRQTLTPQVDTQGAGPREASHAIS